MKRIAIVLAAGLVVGLAMMLEARTRRELHRLDVCLAAAATDTQVELAEGLVAAIHEGRDDDAKRLQAELELDLAEGAQR